MSSCRATNAKACCGSFEPSHEHKEAGVAYLMSLWCDESMLTLAGPR